MNQKQSVSTREVYRGRIVNLKIETTTRADGSKKTREIVEHDDCIAVIAIDEDDNVLLVRQPREAAGKALLEIPAGGIEPGESPIEAVHRELREETGYQPQNVARISGFYASPGYCTEYLHLYLATKLQLAPLHAEDTDDIKLLRVPIGDALRLITSGEICDAKSIAGLLLTLPDYQDNASK
ncbi:MAG: NUDIX hydrolase [Dehalococcoidia bacterium]|nr:NUDIX hydrolase [Dehalococcoidia bacterium]